MLIKNNQYNSVLLVLYHTENEKLKRIFKSSGLKKKDFNDMVINTMKKTFKNKSNYTFKYDLFEKIRTYRVPTYFNVDSNNFKIELSEKFKKSKTIILRELFCTYLENK